MLDTLLLTDSFGDTVKFKIATNGTLAITSYGPRGGLKRINELSPAQVYALRDLLITSSEVS